LFRVYLAFPDLERFYPATAVIGLATKMPGNLGETEKRIAARPSVDHSRAAFAGLLEAIEFRHCTTNAEYLRALGLKVPKNEEKWGWVSAAQCFVYN
jgi:hypothetical protein